MPSLPEQVAKFLASRRIAVAGVSRSQNQPANLIYKKLKDTGHEVFAVNPNTDKVNGIPCFPDLKSIPEPVEAVVVVTHPNAAADVVAECAELGIKQVWFHRSFGQGSVSEEAIKECERSGIICIAGGCPMMYCEPVDLAHRCMRWILKLRHRVPR